MNEQEQEQVEYLIRGLCMYAAQLRVALEQRNREINLAVAERGDEVIEVIKEVQAILKKEED